MTTIRVRSTACDLSFKERDMLRGRYDWSAHVRVAVPRGVLIGNAAEYHFEGCLERIGQGHLETKGAKNNTTSRSHKHSGPVWLTWDGPIPPTWISSNTSDWIVHVWAFADSGIGWGRKKTVYQGHPTGSPQVTSERGASAAS